MPPKYNSDMNITEKMVKYSPDMFCCINRQGHFLKVSEASRKILGYDTQELEGKPYIDFVIPEHRTFTLEVADKILAGEIISAFENSYVAKNGSIIPLRWTAQWNEEEELMFCSARDATELVRYRERVNENVQRYKALFDNNPDVVFLEDKSGALTEVNEAFCKTFGICRDDVLGKPVAMLLSPEMAAVNNMSFKEALAGSTLRYDVTCATSEHQTRTFDAVKFPVVANGEILGIQTIAKDITPIVHSFETITRQTQKLNTIFESITDAFIMLDTNWNFTIINSTAEKILGLSRGHHIGRNIWDEFASEQNGEFYRQYHYAVSTGHSVHFEAYYAIKDIWLEVKAFPSKEGLSIYFDDVTEEVKTRQELEKLSLVANRTDNGVIITDAAGRTEWVNEGFTRMMGYTLPEMQGKKPGDLLQGPDTDKQTLKLIRKRLQQGSHFTAQLLNYTKDGSKIWVSMDITPIRNESGEIVQFIAIQRDITYRKEAEKRQILMTQDLYNQNRALQQFTYIVSHNLRAPVANAIGLTNLLSKADTNSETFAYILASLKKSVVQMDTILRDMNMVLSVRDKQDILEREQVVLVDVFRQACTHLNDALSKCGAKVDVKIKKELRVTANYAYLYSIFYNLISNAIKFRSDDRQLHIKVRGAKDKKGGTVICFADNGIGFDLGKAGSDVFTLYRRFHTNEHIKGRGIGLFLIKTHVEAMGGKIEVNSQLDKGTEFMIYLP